MVLVIGGQVFVGVGSVVILIWDSKVVRHFKVELAHFGFHVLVIQSPFAQAKLNFDCSVSSPILFVLPEHFLIFS